MTLRRRMTSGEGPIVATFVSIPRVEIVEMLADAGFDAVILDLEHGPYGIQSVSPLIAAAHGRGIAAIVRVADDRAQGIGAALDAGADGIVVPHVNTAAQAHAVIDAARFPPDGQRGANPWVRAGAYGTDRRFFDEANDRVAVIGMVEGVDGVANLDEILAVPGLDGVFIGPVDLSSSLGVPGQTEHPDVVQTVADIVRRGANAGVATAVFAPTPRAAARWLGAGAFLVALGVDAGLIAQGLRAVRDALDEDLRSVAPPQS